jgi:nucleotide-binding universal stress UspA family protein
MRRTKNPRKISKILVALDGSKESCKALDYALNIAYRQPAEITAVTVLQYLKGGIVPYAGGIYDKRRISKDRRKIKASLAAAQNRAEEYNIHLNTHIIEGEVSIPAAIIRYAKSHKSNLIVVGSKEKKGIKRALLGSVSSDIISNAHCPVLVVR